MGISGVCLKAQRPLGKRYGEVGPGLAGATGRSRAAQGSRGMGEVEGGAPCALLVSYEKLHRAWRSAHGLLPAFRAHLALLLAGQLVAGLKVDSAHANSRPSGPFAAPLGRPDRPARSRACLASGSEKLLLPSTRYRCPSASTRVVQYATLPGRGGVSRLCCQGPGSAVLRSKGRMSSAHRVT